MGNKQLELDKLRDEIIAKGICQELKSQATQIVFGDGCADSNIVFIGEAPGKKEDLQGRPFVGAAGKLLDEMLEIINLKRQEVYITNIVKYRPPANRDPLPSEKQKFFPYLKRQLEIIKPKIVITLGRHSLNCFLPELQISQVHGQSKIAKLSLGRQTDVIWELVILPLFHPAAALYNRKLRQVLIDDFCRIPTVMKSI